MDRKYELKKIAQRIKEIRLDNNLSQGSFGKILNVSQDTVSLWEKGKSLPNLEYIIKICLYFHLPADYVLVLED